MKVFLRASFRHYILRGIHLFGIHVANLHNGKNDFFWMGLPPTKRSAYFHSFHLFCKFYLQSTKDLDVTLSIRVGKMFLLVSTPSKTEIPLPTPDNLLNLIRCWCLLQYLLQKGFMDVSCSCRINGVCQCLSGKKMS